MADWLPVDFALYGLDENWDGPRWLESWWGAAPVASGVFLSHGERPLPARGHPWVRVGNWAPSGAGWCSPGFGPPERQLAWHAFWHVLGVVAPAFEDEAVHRRFLRNYAPYVDQRADRWARWATTQWHIDSRNVPARFARFGGGWAGYAFEPGELAVSVSAKGVSPRDLGLRKLTSEAQYHFDLDQPIDDELARASKERALGKHVDDFAPSHHLHRDVRNLLDEQDL